MRAVAYARFSSENQRDESIEAQMRAIKKYCLDNNIDLIDEYTDYAISGRTDLRPEFQKMIDKSYSGAFDLVIVHKFDRFARNKYDSVRYKHKLQFNNVKVVSVLEKLDGSPESVLLESLYEGMSEYFSLNLSREVMKGMMENVDQILTTGGTAPLGFDFVDKKYVVNEYEAEAVRIIFDMYTNDCTYKEIINNLTEKGYKTKLNRTFKSTGLYEILNNERYIGTYVYGKRLKENGKRNTHKENKNVIKKENAIPSIIDKKTWEMVQVKMKERAFKHVSARNKAKIEYLLTGRIFCECGAAMHGNTRKGGNGGQHIYSSYRCANKCGAKGIEKKKIESFTMDTIKAYFTDERKKALIEVATKIYMNDKKDAPREKEVLNKELRETDKKIISIVDAISDGMYHKSMKHKLSDLEAKKKEIQNRISKSEVQLSYSVDELSEYLEMILDFESEESQKRSIKIFVEKVTVYKDKIDISILFGLDSNGRGFEWCTQGMTCLIHDLISSIRK